jgi:hypothetical protein
LLAVVPSVVAVQARPEVVPMLTVSAAPVPESAKLVPVPVVVLTVTVSVRLAAEAGLKVIVPVVQEAPEANTSLAVQVPKGAVKSVLSVALNGVADKVTGPPEAVKVIEPVLQVAEAPAPKLPQDSEVGLTVRNAFEVPLRAKLVPVPEAALTVTVSDLALAVAGLKEIVPGLQELPEAIVDPAVQVPKATVKSVPSELLNGVAVKVTGPPEAVKVIVPVQVLEDPALTAGQLIVPVAARAPLTPVPDAV